MTRRITHPIVGSSNMATTVERAETLEEVLAEAEAQLAVAREGHALAKQRYSDSRAQQDIDGMASQMTRVEAAADLLQDAEAKVAAARDAIRIRNVAGDKERQLREAEKVAVRYLATVDRVAEARETIAQQIRAFSTAVQADRQLRNDLRAQLIGLDRAYRYGELGADLAA